MPSVENATVSISTTMKFVIPYLRAVWEETVSGVLVEMVEAEVNNDLVEDLFAVGGAQHGQILDAGRLLEHFPSTGYSRASRSRSRRVCNRRAVNDVGVPCPTRIGPKPYNKAGRRRLSGNSITPTPLCFLQLKLAEDNDTTIQGGKKRLKRAKTQPHLPTVTLPHPSIPHLPHTNPSCQPDIWLMQAARMARLPPAPNPV